MMATGHITIDEKQLIHLINATLNTNFGKLSQIPLDALLRFKAVLELFILISTHEIKIT